MIAIVTHEFFSIENNRQTALMVQGVLQLYILSKFYLVFETTA